MAYLADSKADVIKQFARAEKDTGSAEVQVALLTNHINELTERSGLTPATVSSTLMRLEMKRLIRPLPGKRYTRLV